MLGFNHPSDMKRRGTASVYTPSAVREIGMGHLYSEDGSSWSSLDGVNDPAVRSHIAKDALSEDIIVVDHLRTSRSPLASIGPLLEQVSATVDLIFAHPDSYVDEVAHDLARVCSLVSIIPLFIGCTIIRCKGMKSQPYMSHYESPLGPTSFGAALDIGPIRRSHREFLEDIVARFLVPVPNTLSKARDEMAKFVKSTSKTVATSVRVGRLSYREWTDILELQTAIRVLSSPDVTLSLLLETSSDTTAYSKRAIVTVPKVIGEYLTDNQWDLLIRYL